MLVEFERILGTVLAFRLETSGATAALVVEERVDLGRSRDFVLCAVVAGIWRGAQVLLGCRPKATISLALEEPPYFREVAGVAPPFRFGQSRTEVTFDAAALGLRTLMGDSSSFALARQECLRALDAVADDLVDRLRHAMAAPNDVRTL
jgi:hypothetical protein